MNWVNGFRGMMLVVSVLVLVAMCWQILLPKHFKMLSWGQRLYGLGSILTLAYIVNAAHEAYIIELPWRWRLMIWFWAITCYALWIIQPQRMKNQLAGRKPFTNPENQQ